MQSCNVVIIGSGNVAEAFARSIAKCDGVALRQVFARNKERGEKLAQLYHTEWTCDIKNIAKADFYIIAVSDRSVAEVAQSLVVDSSAIIAHTAGSIAMEAIPERNGRRGIIYPLQSFTAGREITLDDVPLFIEADSEESNQRLSALASKLSSRIEYATSERRRTIHLAGVFVNNFVNHLYALGGDIIEREGLSFDILRPLIAETASKAIASGDPRSVQTGPAIRGDKEVCQRQLSLLDSDKLKQQIYKSITDSIWETSKRI